MIKFNYVAFSALQPENGDALLFDIRLWRDILEDANFSSLFIPASADEATSFGFLGWFGDYMLLTDGFLDKPFVPWYCLFQASKKDACSWFMQKSLPRGIKPVWDGFVLDNAGNIT